MKIGIVGSRRRNSGYDMTLVWNKFFDIPGFLSSTIVSGGCPEGADHFAELISAEIHIPIIIHYPDKSKLDPILIEKKLFRAAYAKINYARNTLIANDSDILLAAVAPDRKGGTEDTIKKFCKKKGKSEKDLIESGELFLV